MAEILLTGGSGQVGSALLALDWPPEIALVAPGRGALNLLDPVALEAHVEAGGFAAIINCAAYTAVDRCESDIVAAWRVNALAPAALAAAAARKGVPILHVSTDYVFDGQGGGYYDERDPVAPIGVYGASKEGGEQAVRTACARHVILRTAWLLSVTGQNFLKTMLRVGAQRPVLGVVNDQIGCPTSAGDIARALQTIVLRHIADAAAPAGTYHFVNSGEASWHELACEIFAKAAPRGGPNPQVNAISTAQYPTPARRPANSRLSTARIREDFGVAPRPWRQAVDEILGQLLPPRPGNQG